VATPDVSGCTLSVPESLTPPSGGAPRCATTKEERGAERRSSGLVSSLITHIHPVDGGCCEPVDGTSPQEPRGVETLPLPSGGIALNQHDQRIRRMKEGVSSAAYAIRQTLADRGDHCYRAVGITLTYAGIDDWRSGDIRSYLNKLRNWLRRRNLPMPYIWVAELQERGAVHYHVMVWLPHNILIPKPDQSEMWPHGCTRVEALRDQNAAGIYMEKYVSKGDETGRGFPTKCRTHGCGGMSAARRLQRSWLRLPGYVQAAFAGPEDRVSRASGGGWRSKATGAWIASMWVVVGFVNGWLVLAPSSLAPV
jgi:hypothetical protein